MLFVDAQWLFRLIGKFFRIVFYFLALAFVAIFLEHNFDHWDCVDHGALPSHMVLMRDGTTSPVVGVKVKKETVRKLVQDDGSVKEFVEVENMQLFYDKNGNGRGPAEVFKNDGSISKSEAIRVYRELLANGSLPESCSK